MRGYYFMSVKSILNLYVLNVARENITKRFYDVTLPRTRPFIMKFALSLEKNTSESLKKNRYIHCVGIRKD